MNSLKTLPKAIENLGETMDDTAFIEILRSVTAANHNTISKRVRGTCGCVARCSNRQLNP
jgi:hypothetical protein